MNGIAREAWSPRSAGDRWPLSAGLVAVGCVATIAASIVGDGNIAVALAPALGLAVLATMWVVPIRHSLFALMFLALAVDGPGDADSLWKSPFNWLGRLLTWNLNKTVPIDALSIPLMTLVLLYLVVIHVHRWLSASRIDDRGDVAVAPPMLWAIGISALTVCALCVNGIRRGGDVQMAKIQVQTFLQLLLMGYLLATTLRGARDYRVLGRLIVAAACSKALMALWVGLTLGKDLAFRTNHGDSILFACAVIILLTVFFEQPTRRNALVCLALYPILFLGMVANNRRIVWVEVLMTLMMLALISRRTRIKVAAGRLMLMALPLVALYGIVGWNSNAQFFAPVHTLRSVGDADIDGSTLYRDIENYNLLATIKQSPIIGVGFGQPYLTLVQNADISFFREWLFLPHNSVLGLWGVGGLFGFTGLWMVLAVAVYFSARRYFESASHVERAAAFSAIAMVAIYLVQSWGDIGFSEMRSIFLVGPALGVSGQIGLTQAQNRLGHRFTSPRA